MEKLYDFLQEHKDQAYTVTELRIAFVLPASNYGREWRDAGTNAQEGFFALDAAIEVLTKIGAVSVREVRSAAYYAFNAPFKKGSWEEDYGSIRI